MRLEDPARRAENELRAGELINFLWACGKGLTREIRRYDTTLACNQQNDWLTSVNASFSLSFSPSLIILFRSSDTCRKLIFFARCSRDWKWIFNSFRWAKCWNGISFIYRRYYETTPNCGIGKKLSTIVNLLSIFWTEVSLNTCENLFRAIAKVSQLGVTKINVQVKFRTDFLSMRIL